MILKGNLVVAVYRGEEVDIEGCSNLAAFMANQQSDLGSICLDICQSLAVLHQRSITIGPEMLQPATILVVESSVGPRAVLMVDRARAGGSPQEDLRATGLLLAYVWSIGDRTPSLLEKDLITTMTEDSSSLTARATLAHLAFWTSARCMKFLTAVSDILELKQGRHIAAVERVAEEVVGSSWLAALHPQLQEKVRRDARRRRDYSETSLQDLLRVVRNLACHYHVLAPEVRAVLGPMEELGRFWGATFPFLLAKVHGAMAPFSRDTNCSSIRQFYMD